MEITPVYKIHMNYILALKQTEVHLTYDGVKETYQG